jgi:hypothetical protein
MPTPVSMVPEPGAEATGSTYATEIDVLRALESGEIDVATAARLLEEKANA